jgi:hypothetical protein
MDYPEQDQGVNKRQKCEQDTKIQALKVVNDVCNTLSVQSRCQELMMKGLRAAKREERFAFFKQFAQEKPMVHKDLVLEILKMGFGGMVTGVELFNKDAKEFLEPFICVMKTKDPAMVQQAVAKMCSEKSMVLRSNLTVTQWLWVFDSTVSFLSSKNPTNPHLYRAIPGLIWIEKWPRVIRPGVAIHNPTRVPPFTIRIFDVRVCVCAQRTIGRIVARIPLIVHDFGHCCGAAPLIVIDLVLHDIVTNVPCVVSTTSFLYAEILIGAYKRYRFCPPGYIIVVLVAVFPPYVVKVSLSPLPALCAHIPTVILGH